MQVTFANKNYEFVPWRPELGQVFQPTSAFAFSCATGLIDEHHPWILPPFVLGAACDGTRGFFIQRNDLEAFFEYHSAVPVIIHDAAFTLALIRQITPDLDIYQMVERNLVWDTQLLHRLLVLGTTGETADGPGESDLVSCVKEYLHIDLPTDVKDCLGKTVKLSYSQWLNRNPLEVESVYLDCLAKNVIATGEIYVVLQQRLQQVQYANSNAFGFVSSQWLQEQVYRWGPQTHHIQLRASIVLREMTKNGTHLDTDKKGELEAYLQEKLKGLHEQLRQLGYLAGQKGSHKALQSALKLLERQKGLRLPRTKNGGFATSRETLQEFADTEPFIKYLLEYQETDNLHKVIVNKMSKGVMHPSFNVMVKTGVHPPLGKSTQGNRRTP